MGHTLGVQSMLGIVGWFCSGPVVSHGDLDVLGRNSETIRVLGIKESLILFYETLSTNFLVEALAAHRDEVI